MFEFQVGSEGAKHTLESAVPFLPPADYTL